MLSCPSRVIHLSITQFSYCFGPQKFLWAKNFLNSNWAHISWTNASTILKFKYSVRLCSWFVTVNLPIIRNTQCQIMSTWPNFSKVWNIWSQANNSEIWPEISVLTLRLKRSSMVSLHDLQQNALLIWLKRIFIWLDFTIYLECFFF